MNKIKTILIFSIAVLGIVLFAIPAPVFAEGINNPFKTPGRIQGTGTSFEITDSRYLNITLESSEEINLIMESIPKIVSLNVKAVQDNTDSVVLSLGGLEPNKAYYKYQDSHKNEDVFVADDTGKFSWPQDLSTTHHIWIQEQKSTTYIDQDTTVENLFNHSC